jgi:hypothetical protein
MSPNRRRKDQKISTIYENRGARGVPQGATLALEKQCADKHLAAEGRRAQFALSSPHFLLLRDHVTVTWSGVGGFFAAWAFFALAGGAGGSQRNW